ncbi:hypothetical protein SVI_2342 [Shewanella violacea DSS12]|uniref:Uncharacterized protein n=1 Tax=Shewanella violacea (strain JCM 10179 / CIP 106290 / LMG 19151 / DSS12) TaxID=637905 RepID=D4ZKW4_SHEVD|nr:hypothetical protein SVI_2342 [Shewanella violacea DSS12]
MNTELKMAFGLSAVIGVFNLSSLLGWFNAYS